MLNNDNLSGVSNCYVFKSRLQEYAQKAGVQTPIYETIKEGPSHQPSFRSTVILNDVRYESLPGFFNRKAAEQSAAEVALMELAKVNQCIAVPIQETGLCKNLLQEYAQKMNYAIPMYKCDKDGLNDRVSGFKCNVEIGGIQYIGGVAKTKKEAEIKAARTALLSIQAGASSDKTISDAQLTVLPSKKKGAEIPAVSKETTHAPKAKKARFKKKFSKKKFPRGKKAGVIRDEIGNLDSAAEPKPSSNHNDADTLPEGGFQPSDPEVTKKCQDGALTVESNGKEKSVVEGSSTSQTTSSCSSKPCVPAEYYRNFFNISSAASTASSGDTDKVTRIEEVA